MAGGYEYCFLKGDPRDIPYYRLYSILGEACKSYFLKKKIYETFYSLIASFGKNSLLLFIIANAIDILKLMFMGRRYFWTF